MAIKYLREFYNFETDRKTVWGNGWNTEGGTLSQPDKFYLTSTTDPLAVPNLITDPLFKEGEDGFATIARNNSDLTYNIVNDTLQLHGTTDNTSTPYIVTTITTTAHTWHDFSCIVNSDTINGSIIRIGSTNTYEYATWISFAVGDNFLTCRFKTGNSTTVNLLIGIYGESTVTLKNPILVQSPKCLTLGTPNAENWCLNPSLRGTFASNYPPKWEQENTNVTLYGADDFLKFAKASGSGYHGVKYNGAGTSFTGGQDTFHFNTSLTFESAGTHDMAFTLEVLDGVDAVVDGDFVIKSVVTTEPNETVEVYDVITTTLSGERATLTITSADIGDKITVNQLFIYNEPCSYFDGSDDNCSWVGTANASVSTLDAHELYHTVSKFDIAPEYTIGFRLKMMEYEATVQTYIWKESTAQITIDITSSVARLRLRNNTTIKTTQVLSNWINDGWNEVFIVHENGTTSIYCNGNLEGTSTTFNVRGLIDGGEHFKLNDTFITSFVYTVQTLGMLLFYPDTIAAEEAQRIYSGGVYQVFSTEQKVSI